MPHPKKLIEVALPLEAINAASAREKSIRHGHPSTLHLWWARRPLAAARAVIFAQMVDDPSAHPDRFPTEEAQQAERQRLFRIVEDLVQWENTTNETVLAAARAEIRRSAPPGGPPPLLDPFAGGGSIPLEAQRLGLEAHASDLNPVAVLINKALIEIPPQFAGESPVNPAARERIGGKAGWKGAAGLADDARYYGKWMRDQAEARIGPLYPKVKLPAAQGGGEATVIAWLWARTVTCPNPACRAQMPLVRSFALSTKTGKGAWVEPEIERSATPPRVRFAVRTGRGKAQEGTVNRRGAKCICCSTAVPFSYLRDEGKAGRLDAKLMAIVAEGQSGRIYVDPNPEHEVKARSAKGGWKSDGQISHWPGRTNVVEYGMTTFGDLFTDRQLVALTTFSDLVQKARAQVEQDTRAAGLPAPRAAAYANAVATYLAFGVDRLADRQSTICSWDVGYTKIRNTFARQAIPMTWDFAEGNPFSESTGNFEDALGWIAKVLESLPVQNNGYVESKNALEARNRAVPMVISTDPPYYDNIGYADLSDFFYVWLRRSLGDSHPQVFGTLLVPKTQELIASRYRHDNSIEKAKAFFEDGLQTAFDNFREALAPAYPMTVYYAFKQSETTEDDDDDNSFVASTGWETMLEGLVRSGFAITGTWPMRTELSNRTIASGTNALASSIVLVCRPRAEDAPAITRRDFLNALKAELPAALHHLQQGNIAPVDLAQASIGPGMAIYSRYSRVVEADGRAMPVRTALALINQALDEYLAEQEGAYDADTRWALAWFEQHGFDEGLYGDAETLSTAKNTSVEGMSRAGIVHARGGRVRLLHRDELDKDWSPARDKRLTVWETTHQLIRRLLDEGSEQATADLLAQLGGLGDAARDLAYRLYALCERKGWAQEAIAYNSLVVAWSEVGKLAQAQAASTPVQDRLL